MALGELSAASIKKTSMADQQCCTPNQACTKFIFLKIWRQQEVHRIKEKNFKRRFWKEERNFFDYSFQFQALNSELKFATLLDLVLLIYRSFLLYSSALG